MCEPLNLKRRAPSPRSNPSAGGVVPGANIYLVIRHMIVKDAFAPGTHLVDKSVNETRSADHEGHIQREKDG